MAIIYSYPLTTPKVKDLLIGTSVFDEDDENSPRNNPTVSFTIKSLLDMIGTGGSQTLQQVTNLGASTTNAITIANGLSVTGTFTDSTGGVGIAGQVLSSTNIGTAWVSDAGGTVKSVAATHAGNAFSASIGNVATVNPSVDITMNGITAQYVNGAGNLATLLDIPGLITSLTTNGTSGVSTLVGRVLNIPNYANTQNTLTTTGTGAATLVGTVLNIPTPVIPFTSLTTTGSGAATLATGVLNIPTPSTPVIPFTSLTTVGTSGASTLTTGVLNIPDYTYTEIDTLQSVTARGDTTNQKILMNGSGADGYLYVTGNAGNPVTNPTHAQGFAFAYNNSGGSRECEVFWNTGTTTAAINNVSYLGFYNEFLNSDAGNARVTDTQLKLYGTGELELVGATPTISNPYWRMPTTAAPNTGYVLAKASGSINLEWVPNANTTETFVLTATQMQGLSSTPVTLLPSPGANKAYKILACSTYLNFAVAFSASTSLSIYTTDGVSTSNQVAVASGAFLATSSTLYTVTGSSFSHNPIYVNSALLIDAGVITGGTGSTFSIKLTYQTLDTNNF